MRMCAAHARVALACISEHARRPSALLKWMISQQQDDSDAATDGWRLESHKHEDVDTAEQYWRCHMCEQARALRLWTYSPVAKMRACTILHTVVYVLPCMLTAPHFLMFTSQNLPLY
jgi:hypothetical protein